MTLKMFNKNDGDEAWEEVDTVEDCKQELSPEEEARAWLDLQQVEASLLPGPQYSQSPWSLLGGRPWSPRAPSSSRVSRIALWSIL